jgi:hypothetical protein
MPYGRDVPFSSFFFLPFSSFSFLFSSHSSFFPSLQVTEKGEGKKEKMEKKIRK